MGTYQLGSWGCQYAGMYHDSVVPYLGDIIMTNRLCCPGDAVMGGRYHCCGVPYLEDIIITNGLCYPGFVTVLGVQGDGSAWPRKGVIHYLQIIRIRCLAQAAHMRFCPWSTLLPDKPFRPPVNHSLLKRLGPGALWPAMTSGCVLTWGHADAPPCLVPWDSYWPSCP